MTTGIYKLTFANGSVYIGQALNAEERYKQHCQKLLDGNHTAKLRAAYAASNFCMPCYEVLIDCHRNYLDLFESIVIHDTPAGIRLNTSIPENMFAGGTQGTLNVLMENRHNSIISLVDKLNVLGVKVEGLKTSLVDAEEEIDNLEYSRTEEEIASAGRDRVVSLKQEALRLSSTCVNLSSHNNTLQKELSKTLAELKHLKSRTFLQRLFNK